MNLNNIPTKELLEELLRREELIRQSLGQSNINRSVARSQFEDTSWEQR